MPRRSFKTKVSDFLKGKKKSKTINKTPSIVFKGKGAKKSIIYNKNNITTPLVGNMSVYDPKVMTQNYSTDVEYQTNTNTNKSNIGFYSAHNNNNKYFNATNMTYDEIKKQEKENKIMNKYGKKWMQIAKSKIYQKHKINSTIKALKEVEAKKTKKKLKPQSRKNLTRKISTPQDKFNIIHPPHIHIDGRRVIKRPENLLFNKGLSSQNTVTNRISKARFYKNRYGKLQKAINKRSKSDLDKALPNDYLLIEAKQLQKQITFENGIIEDKFTKKGERVNRLQDSPPYILYHATPLEGATGILKDGNFRLGHTGSVGGGVYFSDEPRMCCEKFMGRQSPTAKIQQVQSEVPELHILICLVRCGNMIHLPLLYDGHNKNIHEGIRTWNDKINPKYNKSNVIFKNATFNELQKYKIDSVLYNQYTTGHEIVIYNTDQITPIGTYQQIRDGKVYISKEIKDIVIDDFKKARISSNKKNIKEFDGICPKRFR